MLSRGIVIDVSDPNLIILEYDYMEEQEAEIIYEYDDEVELDNVASLGDLEVGDLVEVLYEEEEDIRKARRVTLK